MPPACRFAILKPACAFRDLTKEERKALIKEAEEERRQEATLTITAALRAKRFKKLLNNTALIGNDPALAVEIPLTLSFCDFWFGSHPSAHLFCSIFGYAW